jgi:hypothetical protein
MSVGVTKDYKLKVKNLHASRTVGEIGMNIKAAVETQGKTKKKRKRLQRRRGLLYRVQRQRHR